MRGATACGYSDLAANAAAGRKRGPFHACTTDRGAAAGQRGWPSDERIGAFASRSSLGPIAWTALPVSTKFVQNMNDEDGDAPDLHAARGLLPAILIGSALWALAFVAAIMLW